MITDFEKKVYEITSKIPKRKVTTYKIIAEKLCSSPRAVGNALARNPFAPKVPCHRVIKTNGNIGGFMGEKNLHSDTKIHLLQNDGVEISKDGIVNKNLIYNDF